MFRPVWSVVIVALLVSCNTSGDGPRASATPCKTPEAVTDLSDVPEDLPFKDWGTVTYLRKRRGFAVVRLVSETSVVELHPQIARAVIDAGYEIVGADNEGFESEIFFKPGRERTGYFQLREGPCEGQVSTTMIFGQR